MARLRRDLTDEEREALGDQRPRIARKGRPDLRQYSDAEIRRFRQRYAEGATVPELCVEFFLNAGTLRQILVRKTYRNVR